MIKLRKVLQVLAVAAIIALGANMISGCNAGGGSVVGGKEEYKVLMPEGGDVAQLEKLLNDYAKQGWKVRSGGWGNGFSFIILAR